MFYLTLEKIFKIYVGLGTQDYYTAYIRLKMKKKFSGINAASSKSDCTFFGF